MQLVALISPDQALRQALAQFRKPALGVLLHPVTPTEFSAVAGSLAPLEFRGALVLDEGFHEAAFRVAQRSSLMAQETGTADALTVSYGGLIAEYTLGRAVVTALQQKGWDARGGAGGRRRVGATRAGGVPRGFVARRGAYHAVSKRQPHG